MAKITKTTYSWVCVYFFPRRWGSFELKKLQSMICKNMQRFPPFMLRLANLQILVLECNTDLEPSDVKIIASLKSLKSLSIKLASTTIKEVVLVLNIFHLIHLKVFVTYNTFGSKILLASARSHLLSCCHLWLL